MGKKLGRELGKTLSKCGVAFWASGAGKGERAMSQGFSVALRQKRESRLSRVPTLDGRVGRCVKWYESKGGGLPKCGAAHGRPGF